MTNISQFSPVRKQGTNIIPKIDGDRIVATTGAFQFSQSAADPVGLGVGDTGYTYWNTTSSLLRAWDGATFADVGGGGAGSLQGAYDGGKDILTAAGQPVQFRDSGIALDQSNVVPGIYAEFSTPGLAMAIASDNSFGPPTMAVGAMAITDSAVVLSGGTIDFGFDVTVIAGNVRRQLAIPGATVNFLPLGLISVKTSDNAADPGQYTAVSVANGLATNSLVTVVDAATQAPVTFLGTAGTASAFNQSVGLNGDETEGGARNVFIGAADGNGLGTLTGAFSDNGDYNTMQTLFNIGNLRGGMVQLINGGALVGADADKPFIQMGGFGPFQPDNGDIQFANRAADPTTSVTFGPSLNVSFQNNSPNQDTITVAGGGLIAAGFKWNSNLDVTGSASNNGQYRIESVTDTVITLADPGVLTNEGAGASVTLEDRLVESGTLWYNATGGGGFKYLDSNGTIQAFGASTLQQAYTAGNSITPSGGGGPLNIRLAGSPYGNANASFYLFDGHIPDSGGGNLNLNNSTFTELIGGNTGAPHEIRERVIMADSSFTVVPVQQSQGTDIAFVNSNPDTITSTVTDFTLAGFQTGDRITISGTTGGLNDGQFTIDTVATNTITLIATDSLVAQGSGPLVTIKAHTKLEFGAAIDFSSWNTPVPQGAYKNVDLNFGFTSIAVKSTDIDPTDTGTLFVVTNITDGAGTASQLQIANPFGDQTDPNFTATSGTALAKVQFGIVGPGAYTTFGLPDLDFSGSLAGLQGTVNDGGTGANLSRHFNGDLGVITDAMLRLTNVNTSGGADVPLIGFSQFSPNGVDLRWSLKSADPASPSPGDTWFNVTGTDRLKIRTSTGTEDVAFLSDISGGAANFYDATVGATGADYTTVNAAILAGARRLLMIDNTTETTNTAGVNVDVTITILDGFNWDVGPYFIDFSASCDWTINGQGRITFAHTSGSFPLFNRTGGNIILTIDGISIDNNSTVGLIKVADSAIVQRFSNIYLNIGANGNGGGLDNTQRETVYENIRISATGTGVAEAVIMSDGTARNVFFVGGNWAASPTIGIFDITGDGVVVDNIKYSGTVANVSFQLAGSCSNIVQDTASQLDLNISLSGTQLTNFTCGDLIWTVTIDNATVSNGRVFGNLTMATATNENQVNNVQVSGTGTLLGNLNQISNSYFANTLTVTDDNCSITGTRVGPEISGTGITIDVLATANNTQITGCRVDSAITDAGTNTVETGTLIY